MLKGFKYRIYPTKEQEIQLAKTFGSCRFIYNQLLAKKIELYKEERKSLSYANCSAILTTMKKEEFVWLKEVDKFSLQNSLKDLDSAYTNFFRRVKQGDKELGFPKFKSKRNHNYSYKTNFTNNNIEVDFHNNKVKLPKLKWIKCKLHREFNGAIKNATISKTPSNKYFVSFCVEVEHNALPMNDNEIGIDLGVKDLVITSNGEVFENNKYTYKYEKQLAELQRQFAKKTKGSNNWNKHRIKVARLHEKISNIRKNNLNKISSTIIKENQFIFTEDLNIKGMLKNRKLSKSISDCGWYELTRQLEYKSEWNNRIYLKVNRYFPSSQLCNKCGYKNKDTKSLGIRFWECPECGELHDRDKNASINILNEGIKQYKLLVG